MTSKKILIVDDEKDIRDVLAEVFSYHGYEPICAGDAEDALKLLTPDIQVMFLDLKLPGKMDGLALCRQIRMQIPAACIFAMTGYATLFELADCRAAGFDDYFTKPTKLELLLMATRQGFDKVKRWQKK
ncbi:MAG: response regulator transcription factor [Desulfobulbaceae bacterium]|nr:response regulator transcription factor [Desulfobulbaceae bacterium]